MNLSHTKKGNPSKILIIVTLLLGITFSYYGSGNPRFIDDDTDLIMGVSDISLDKDDFYLPKGYVHGPITLILMKTSGLLFGENAFGWRMFNVIFKKDEMLINPKWSTIQYCTNAIFAIVVLSNSFQ